MAKQGPGGGKGGNNLYCVCGNSLIVSTDVLGLFGPAIHRDATIQWAGELGIRSDVATVIGAEDDGVDTMFSALKFLSQIEIGDGTLTGRLLALIRD